MKDTEDLALALRQFTGTEQWYRHWFNKKMLYTDGVKFFAEEAGGGAYWFLDIVATEIFGLLEANPFLAIKLVSENGRPIVIAEDGNNNVLFKRDDIEYTDCPEGTWLFFMSDNVMLLPSEN